MVDISIPESGLVLGEVPISSGTKGGTHGSQAMRIAFADSDVLEEVLKHGADLKISFGKSMRLAYGDQSMEVVAAGETYRHEIYQRKTELQRTLDFVGILSHNLEVRELDEDSPDESLLKLRKGYELLNDQKAASTPMVVDSSDLPAMGTRRNRPQRNSTNLRKPLAQGRPHSASATPLLKSARSPLPDQIDATPSKDAQAKLDALRVPIIHLLALGPASEHSLSIKTKASEDLCARVLQRVAHKTIGGRQWEMIDDVYKDLDVWDFPYNTLSDRSKAIQSCRDAFTRLKLDKGAPGWRSILSPEEKEKADSIQESLPLVKPVNTRVNLNAAAETAHSPQTSLEQRISNEDSLKPTAQLLPKSVKSTPKDPISRIIAGRKKKGSTPAKPRGTVGRPAKNATTKTAKSSYQKTITPSANSKIKSAEIVYDSDEDIELEDILPKKYGDTSQSPPRRGTQAILKVSPDVNSDMEAESVHPVSKKIATSIPGSIPRTGRKLGSSSSTKSPSRASINTSKQHNNHKPLSSKESSGGRGSSNSPAKPSPLGCSQPINASDADDVSASSSPSFLTSNTGSSTASHSPLDTLSLKANKPRYIPSSVSSLKRKAPENNTPAKSTAKAPTSNSMTYPSQLHSSVPDAQIIKLARRFKEDYARYERLYKEVQITMDTHKKKEKIERVLAMHKSLESLKHKISIATSN